MLPWNFEDWTWLSNDNFPKLVNYWKKPLMLTVKLIFFNQMISLLIIAFWFCLITLSSFKDKAFKSNRRAWAQLWPIFQKIIQFSNCNEFAKYEFAFFIRRMCLIYFTWNETIDTLNKFEQIYSDFGFKSKDLWMKSAFSESLL